MKAHLERAFMTTAKAVLHFTGPNTPGRTILRNLFKEIVVCVKEEGYARHEAVYVQTCFNTPRHILDSVSQSEGEFLCGSGAGLADVIAAYGNRVVTRNTLGAELECIHHQLHRRLNGINPLFLRDV